MKILAAALATCLLAVPAFAQKPTPPAGTAPAPGDAAQEPAQAPPGTTADKPATEPEPEEAPAGTEPVKPADAPEA